MYYLNKQFYSKLISLISDTFPTSLFGRWPIHDQLRLKLAHNDGEHLSRF